MGSDDATVEGAPQAENTCAGCGLPAKMACPHCVKIKASEPQDFASEYGVAYYCTQDCFKKHWKTHKTQHKPGAAAVEIATPLPGGNEHCAHQNMASSCLTSTCCWRTWSGPVID